MQPASKAAILKPAEANTSIKQPEISEVTATASAPKIVSSNLALDIAAKGDDSQMNDSSKGRIEMIESMQNFNSTMQEMEKED